MIMKMRHALSNGNRINCGVFLYPNSARRPSARIVRRHVVLAAAEPVESGNQPPAAHLS